MDENKIRNATKNLHPKEQGHFSKENNFPFIIRSLPQRDQPGNVQHRLRPVLRQVDTSSRRDFLQDQAESSGS